MEQIFGWKLVFGWTATGLSLIYKVPQIIKLYKTKDASSLSFLSLICQFLSYSFYIIHGIIIDDPPIVTMGIVSIVQSLLIVVMYCYYQKKYCCK
jgi:MtN3 and saliva related transmembrane protein